jgi:chromosome segregation protein
LTQEKTFSEEELSNRNEKKEEIEESLKRLEEFDDFEFDFEEKEEAISSLKEGLDEKEEDLKHLQCFIESDTQDLLGIDQEIFKNNSKIEEYSKNLEDLNIEIEEVEKRYSGFSNKIVEERQHVQNQKEELNKLDEEEKELSLIVDQLKNDYEPLKGDYNKKTKEIIRCETTLQSLIDLKSSLEDTGQGPKKLIKDHEGKFKIFGHIIECDEKYTKGVQAILGDLLNTIISREGKEKDFFSWFKSNEDQRLEVYCPLYKDFKSDDDLSGELKARLELSGFKGVKGIKDLLKVEEGYGHGITDLLSGFYLVDKVELCKIEEISKDLNFKAIASLDGKIVVKKCEDGHIINVNPGNASGMVDRNNKIKDLEESLKDLKSDFSNLEEKLNSTEIELKKNKESYEIKNDKKLRIREEYRVFKSGLEIKLENHTFNSSRLKNLKERKQDYSEARLSHLESEEKNREAKEEKEEKIEELKLRFEESEENLKIERENYNVKKEEFLRKKLEVESYDEKLKTFKDQHIDLGYQVEKCKTRILVHKKSIDENQLAIQKIVFEIQDLELKNNQKVEDLKDREDLLGSLKDNVAELLLEMEEKEKRLKILSSQINKFEKEIVEFDAKSERFLLDEEDVVKNIFEKYRVDLRHSVGNFLNFTLEDYEELNNLGNLFFQIDDGEEKSIEKVPFEFIKKSVQDIKSCQSKLRNLKNEYSSLGEVNWQAIENYNHQKVRFDFLKEQEDELNKSLIDLNEAIFQIDEKSKERFQVAFEEVNERFEKVFPIIFGGGEGCLRLTNKIDETDAGVDIIASPPGKKMQNINLMSGGEKALTAVSLIFSIFLVKPSPFCLLDEVDAPLDDANVGRFNDLLGEMSSESQFILITHNKKTMELNDRLYGVTMQEPGISKAMSIQLQ